MALIEIVDLPSYKMVIFHSFLSSPSGLPGHGHRQNQPRFLVRGTPKMNGLFPGRSENNVDDNWE